MTDTATDNRRRKKRLVICMDGTWQNLAWQAIPEESDDVTKRPPDRRTNVSKIAQLTLPHASDGTAQLVFYSPGVGARTYSEQDKEMHYAGATGKGADENIIAAYMFLSFNYEPGDEIYLFGFSRGAFCVRSLGGLISRCGIIKRSQTQYVRNAIELYRRPLSDSSDNDAARFRKQFSVAPVVGQDGCPMDAPGAISIAYIGVFDTVVMNKRFHEYFTGQSKATSFHDLKLGKHVRAARHAMAFDERRKTLPVTPWSNLRDFCAKAGFKATDPEAPYQQKFFAGAHGDCGGGEDRLLSAVSRKWILRGACKMGLELDEKMQVDGTPDAPEFLNGQIEKFEGGALSILGYRDRICYPETPDPNAPPRMFAMFGPRPPEATVEALDEFVHVSAVMRMRAARDPRYAPKAAKPFQRILTSPDPVYEQWLKERSEALWK
ncbi:DUF2235 domain-containing protein [Terricaulis sp.]|uniref:DUF2235 domain-containing protein n=1 Tax=Terricaulis sp. TaxID=2768686 RepID=UPI003783BF9A